MNSFGHLLFPLIKRHLYMLIPRNGITGPKEGAFAFQTDIDKLSSVATVPI